METEKMNGDVEHLVASKGVPLNSMRIGEALDPAARYIACNHTVPPVPTGSTRSGESENNVNEKNACRSKHSAVRATEVVKDQNSTKGQGPKVSKGDTEMKVKVYTN
ncbi:hypothetical protein CBL_09333 [Carabus blaptoides fortunei]